MPSTCLTASKALELWPTVTAGSNDAFRKFPIDAMNVMFSECVYGNEIPPNELFIILRRWARSYHSPDHDVMTSIKNFLERITIAVRAFVRRLNMNTTKLSGENRVGSLTSPKMYCFPDCEVDQDYHPFG